MTGSRRRLATGALPGWLLLGLRAAVTALLVFPWVQLAAYGLEMANPLSIPTMLGWLVLAGAVTAWLRRRPRRLITHVAVHLGAGLFAYLAWIAQLKGIPLALPGPAWWRALHLAASPAALAAELFWLGWWGAFWWRGAVLATVPPDPSRMGLEFELGLIAWGMALLIGVGTGFPTAALLPALFAFFLTGLATLAWRKERGSVPALPAALLLGATAAGAFGVLALAVGTGGPVSRALKAAFAVALAGLEALLRWLFRLPPADPRSLETPGQGWSLPPDAGPPGGDTPAWLAVLLWLLVGILTAVAAVVLVRGLVQLWRLLLSRVRAAQVTGAAVTWADQWRLLRALWRLWRRRRRRLWVRWRQARHHLAAACRETVRPRCARSLYRGLLRWGWLAGLPRRPHETPYEYERRLAAALPPGGVEAVRRLTELYVATRYDPSRAEGVPAELVARYRDLFRPATVLRARWRAWRGR